MTRNWKHNVYYLVLVIGYFMLYYWMKTIYDEEAIWKVKSFWTLPIIGLIFYVLFGIVLGVLQLAKGSNYVGKLKFDYMRLLILGVPVLIFALRYFWTLIPGGILNGFAIKLKDIPPSLPQILFGFILSTCFYRSEEVSRSE
jgi:hypothetical protein